MTFAATKVKLIYSVLKKLIQEMQNSYCIRKKFWKTKIFILDFHVMQFWFKFRSKSDELPDYVFNTDFPKNLLLKTCIYVSANFSVWRLHRLIFSVINKISYIVAHYLWPRLWDITRMDQNG